MDTDTIPKLYDYDILSDAWDELMQEYSEITGFDDYGQNLKTENHRNKKRNELNIIYGCYLLMRLGSDNSIELLKEVGIIYDKVSPENIKKLRSKILSIRTRMEIEGIIKKETSDNKKTTFEEIMVGLEMALERAVDRNMTVADYVYTVKAIDKKAAQLKKLYGKQN